MTIENLKCCGNCKNRRREYYGLYYLEQCGKHKEPIGSGCSCKDWQFDGLEKKERKI